VIVLVTTAAGLDTSSCHKTCHAADPTASGAANQSAQPDHYQDVDPAEIVQDQTRSPCPAGPNVKARMGLSGLCLWYGAPPHGARRDLQHRAGLGERGQGLRRQLVDLLL
jgi:hypothetical protein